VSARRLAGAGIGAGVLLGAAAVATACAPRYRFPPPFAPPAGHVEEGVASWYGPGYHGNRTSSGEPFDQDALTAAHPSYVFGTRVKVTLLSTGRSVVVRINDRFPAHKGRIIDVSRAAARAIGLIGPGTGRVRLEIVGVRGDGGPGGRGAGSVTGPAVPPAEAGDARSAAAASELNEAVRGDEEPGP
jgi:rare lipoprotein A (peptidoglycan hydrolase)